MNTAGSVLVHTCSVRRVEHIIIYNVIIVLPLQGTFSM